LELPAAPTVADALRGLPLPGEDSALHNHTGRVHSQRIIERYRNLRYGERDPATRINKLDPERPSYTIIVGSDKGGGKGHVHPFEPREVTPRESARMQGFPDHWEFTGTVRHPIRQVGNAVPPLFAAKMAYHLKREVFRIDDEPSHEELLDSLGLNYLLRQETPLQFRQLLRTGDGERVLAVGVAADGHVPL
jgi:DNA (cytosine-5)-methyltransferase 1